MFNGNGYYKFMKGIAKLVFPQRDVIYKSQPEEGEVAVYVSNHSGAIGPANMTLFFDRPFRAWSISCLFDKEIAPNYIYHDFFFGRSKKFKSFYRGLSRIIAPMLIPLIERQNPIVVYRGSNKMLNTFRESVKTLKDNQNVVIFGECPEKYTENVNRLYRGFADIGRLYYNDTGKTVKFYPVYIPTQTKVIYVGSPVEYLPQNEKKQERERIASVLEQRIDELGKECVDVKKIPFLREEFYEYYSEYVENPEEYWRLCQNKRSE